MIRGGPITSFHCQNKYRVLISMPINFAFQFYKLYFCNFVQLAKIMKYVARERWRFCNEHKLDYLKKVSSLVGTTDDRPAQNSWPQINHVFALQSFTHTTRSMVNAEVDMNTATSFVAVVSLWTSKCNVVPVVHSPSQHHEGQLSRQTTSEWNDQMSETSEINGSA